MVKLFKRKKKHLDVPVPPSKKQVSGLDLPEIKKLVGEPANSLPAPSRELPLHRLKGPLPGAPKTATAMPPPPVFKEPSIKRIKPKVEVKESLKELETKAPLFIKIDKYRDVVKDIQRLKSFSLTLRDALDALSDMERELRTGLDLTVKALDRFNSVISVLDSKFLRFQSIGPGEREKMSKSSEEIDHYVKDLYDQMEKIRHELRTISV